MARNDTLARALGILVFVVGIGVLVFVFIMAYRMFSSEGLLVAPTMGKGPSTAQNLGSSALVILLRLALLFIMALVGSLVAGRGIQLYFAGEPNYPEKT